MRIPKKYDFYLIIFTIIILFVMGIVCLYGIAYYDYLAVDPQWTRTLSYVHYIAVMDSYLYPFLVLLLISLGLCIPKRLLKQDILIKFSAMALVVTAGLTFLFGIETGLGFILAIVTGIQGIVLILTIKKSKVLRYEKEGYIERLGSSLLHLGLIILVFNFVTLREIPYHVSIFWMGTLFITAGNIFSFYPERITSLLYAK